MFLIGALLYIILLFIEILTLLDWYKNDFDDSKLANFILLGMLLMMVLCQIAFIVFFIKLFFK